MPTTAKLQDLVITKNEKQENHHCTKISQKSSIIFGPFQFPSRDWKYSPQVRQRCCIIKFCSC